MGLQFDFRRILLAEMKRQGLSYQEVGNLVGTTKQAVQHHAAGRTSPSLKTVEKYLRGLEITARLTKGAKR